MEPLVPAGGSCRKDSSESSAWPGDPGTRPCHFTAKIDTIQAAPWAAATVALLVLTAPAAGLLVLFALVHVMAALVYAAASADTAQAPMPAAKVSFTGVKTASAGLQSHPAQAPSLQVKAPAIAKADAALERQEQIYALLRGAGYSHAAALTAAREAMVKPAGAPSPPSLTPQEPLKVVETPPKVAEAVTSIGKSYTCPEIQRLEAQRQLLLPYGGGGGVPLQGALLTLNHGLTFFKLGRSILPPCGLRMSVAHWRIHKESS